MSLPHTKAHNEIELYIYVNFRNALTPWARSPDFIYRTYNPFDCNRIGEIKIPREANYARYINDVPDFHYFQVHFQMFVTGCRYGALAYGREIPGKIVPVKIIEYKMNKAQEDWLGREAIKIERKIIRRMIKLLGKTSRDSR